MRSIGIQPDILLCRVREALPDAARRKIALFTNVEEAAVISGVDVDNIYDIPELYVEQKMDQIVTEQLKIDAGPPDLSEWRQVNKNIRNPVNTIRVCMVGKYISLTESYKSLSEALIHAGIHTRTKIDIQYIDSTEIEEKGTGMLNGASAILIPGDLVKGVLKA